MPPTLSELEAVPILLKGSGVGKGRGNRRVVDGPAPDEEGKAHPLVWDVVKSTPASMSWE